MAVFIDDMYKHPIGQFGRMKMSHMIQDYDTPREHFDVAMVKRTLAIKHGAIEITYRELAEKTRTRTYEGKTQVY